MASYKLYFLNPLGHIEQARDIVCASDEEAYAILEAEGRYAELWERDRFVKCSDTLVAEARANDRPKYPQIE